MPAYNAESTIEAVLWDVGKHRLPVIVVDDGSIDGTTKILDRMEVTRISHCNNRGKGAALRTGFAWALAHGCTGVVTLDSDGQHDPAAIPVLVKTAATERYDLLIASRFAQFEQMAGLRKYWNRFGVWCVRKRTGFDITDSQSGFRYYSRELLEGIQLNAAGYDIEMEIIMKAWHKGFRIGSLSVPALVADGRATSHYRSVSDTWQICKTFLKNM
jgi:glycosyltransferase involved in cell wall biosynthesis